MEYTMTTPCPQCPFRSDIRPYLHPARVREIERALERSDFPCHKTLAHDDDGATRSTSDSIHCAGALILLEKLDRPSQMMRICERLGFYDRTKLDMDAPVFGSFDEMYRANKREATKGARKQ